MPVSLRWGVGAAVAVSLVLAFVGPAMIATYFWDGGETTLAVGGVLAAVLALALAPGRTDRWVRVAVLLPLAHLAALIAIWVWWSGRPPPVGFTIDRMPMLDHLTIGAALAGSAAFVLAAGAFVGRRGEHLHAVVMVSLSTLLLAGLWLPIAARTWWGPPELAELTDGGLAAWVLVPPAVCGVLFTALARVPRPPYWVEGGVCALFLVSLLSYPGRPDFAGHVFDNYLHVVLALAAVSIGALALLAVSIGVRRLRGATLAGVVADDGVIARVEITSWLRGPRSVVRAFTLTTEHGDVHVPGGELVASLDPASTLLARGESMPVIRGGDAVVLTGFVEPDRDHPFRDSTAPLASGRVQIARAGDRNRSIAYAMWRPSLAYLAVLVGIAIPGLLAAALH